MRIEPIIGTGEQVPVFPAHPARRLTRHGELIAALVGLRQSSNPSDAVAALLGLADVEGLIDAVYALWGTPVRTAP